MKPPKSLPCVQSVATAASATVVVDVNVVVVDRIAVVLSVIVVVEVTLTLLCRKAVDLQTRHQCSVLVA